MRLGRLGIQQGKEVAPAATTADGDLHLQRTLRRAADALTPVAIDLGPQLPRIGTFVDAVDGDGETGSLILHPASVDAIPGAAWSTVVIRSCDPADAWMLTAGPLQPVGDRSARVALGGAVIAPLANRTRARTPGWGHDSLVLSVPSGTEDLDGCVFPVLGLGASHCIAEAAVPLPPGQRFDPVEIVGNRRILRRAAATVLEAVPWVDPDGSRRFRCRLQLESSDGARAPQAFDLLSQRQRITRLLELACMLTNPGWYAAPGWPRGTLRFEALERNRLILRLEQPQPDTIPLPVHVYLGCELFAVSYQAQVRPLRRRGTVLEVTVPLVMRRQRRRREQRARIPAAGEVWMTFRSPATGLEQRRRVRDLSFGGLCFEADPAADVIWPGITLEEVRITMPGRSIVGGEVEVRGIEAERDGTLVCHAASHLPGRTSDRALGGLLGALKHPGVEMHDGSGFPAVLDLYRRTNLLAEFIERNLAPVLPAAAAAWQRLHHRTAQIGCTFLYPGADGPRAAFSGVRAWEQTWLAQHFAALPGGTGQESGAVHVAYFDYVLSRPEAHYLAFFVKADNSAMNSFQGRFLELTGTPECVARATVEFWRCGHPGPDLRRRDLGGGAIREMEPDDERLVMRAAERTLGALPARALSLVEGQLGLPDTHEAFRQASLRRAREAYVVSSSGGRPALAVLGESATPGINLTFMLNAWWLLPIRQDAGYERALATALQGLVFPSPPPSPAGDRFVITVPGTGVQPLVDAGFESLGQVHLFVLHRSGIHRYYQHIADRYGQVSALTARRDSQRRRAAR